MRVILFDIDGTLMLSGGAGARALTRAFEEVFGISDALAGVRLNGMTDVRIIDDALTLAGRTLPAPPADLARLRGRYLELLTDEMPRADKARILPGVRELLECLAGSSGFLVGLLTGNIEAGARIKLGRFDLNRFLPFGAFGSDSAIRRDLVPIAIDRAQGLLDGARISAADVVVVGDTEHDVDCGRHSGARTLAVATGGVDAPALSAAGADAVVDDLSDTRRVMDLLGTL